MRFAAHAKKFFSRFFSLRIFASDQSEINRAYFRFVSLPKIFTFRFFFVLFSLHFILFSLQMQKKAKKHFFRIKAKKHFFWMKAKKVSLPFSSFRFEAKMMAVFRSFFVLFSLRSIFVSLQISMFRIDAKQAKKALFSHRSEKNFTSVSLHFASKQK
jgi:hypothetical protein